MSFGFSFLFYLVLFISGAVLFCNAGNKSTEYD